MADREATQNGPQPDSTGASSGVEWWPLDRLLTEVKPGSHDDDWTWQQEHDDLWFGPHADTHGMDRLASSLQEIGQQNPVLIGDDGRLWDGPHRVAAAMRLGFATVLVVHYADMTEDERFASLIASIEDAEDARRV